MRYLLILFAFLALDSYASEEVRRMAPQFYRISSDEIDISKAEAKFTFRIYNIDELTLSATVRYSIDGEESKVKLNRGEFSVVTTPGKHKFIIYINKNYEEMYSDSLKIEGGFEDIYNVQAQSATIEVIMDKPVIYLYPELSTDVKVTVEPAGEMTFTYPAYENGWNVTANPDGTIECNGESFNYLFWEAKKEMTLSEISEVKSELVRKENVVYFLEERLSEAGFTSKEKADFITYWAPRMIQFEQVFVQFIQGPSCDQFATLGITPKPDNLNRFYMTWGEYSAGTIIVADPSEKSSIQKMNRDGFDALEWGGQQVILEELSETL